MKFPLSPLRRAAMGILIHCGLLVSNAETITLFPTADATLIELWPTNSMGAGGWISSGTTQNGNSNRALVKFDVAAAVPAGATITGAGLYLWVTRSPVDGNTDSVFSLRRMLRPWGEGENPTPEFSPGFGLPAQGGDATWAYAMARTNAWAIPGGLEGVDYSSAVSSSAFVAGVSTQPYFFESGGSVADVQLWLDRPDLNFGWMLKSEDELSRFTARRFGSRELGDPGSSPQLTIDYLLPLRISSVQASSNRMTLTFNTDPGYAYRVEARAPVVGTNEWAVLTNFAVSFLSAERSFTDLHTNAQRFYRLRRD